jgi:SAM-dependent methyltransferase
MPVALSTCDGRFMDTDIDHGEPSAVSSAWAWAFAVLYDPLLRIGERAEVRADREDLLRGARGCTVEIGGGTGLNLPFYPDDVDELVLTEPDAAMRSRLATTMRQRGRRARLVDAAAQHLPFADESVDTVVSTFVLCTVDAPDLALREMARVLRPDGQLLFIEHVRSDSPRLARWQDRLVGPWRRLARGCRCNRATGQLIATCGFELDHVRDASWRGMPPILRPLIIGGAHKAAAITETVSRVADDAWAAGAKGELAHG